MNSLQYEPSGEWSTAGRVGALAGGVTGALLLLRRMRRELLGDGRLSSPSVAAMYCGYLTHAGVVLAAARRHAGPLPLPKRVARPTGMAAMACGVVLFAAGIRRFNGPAHASGTDPGQLVTTGVYRFSRNPQYLGMLLCLGGLAVISRSGAVLALGVSQGAILWWWITVEERHLRHHFGDAYRAYETNVRRWVSLPTGG